MAPSSTGSLRGPVDAVLRLIRRKGEGTLDQGHHHQAVVAGLTRAGHGLLCEREPFLLGKCLVVLKPREGNQGIPSPFGMAGLTE